MNALKRMFGRTTPFNELEYWLSGGIFSSAANVAHKQGRDLEQEEIERVFIVALNDEENVYEAFAAAQALTRKLTAVEADALAKGAIALGDPNLLHEINFVLNRPFSQKELFQTLRNEDIFDREDEFEIGMFDLLLSDDYYPLTKRNRRRLVS